jgi:UDP-glucuronate 4-epimerase
MAKCNAILPTIDDIVEGIMRVMEKMPESNTNWDSTQPDPGTSKAPYRLYNIGNNSPVELMHLIAVLEECLGQKAKKNILPMQPGDVVATYADVDDLTAAVGFKPSTSIETGVAAFVDWYRKYYAV